MAKKSAKSKKPAPQPLEGLKAKLEKSRQLAEWVESALEHRDRFAPQVVLTVVGDYLDQWVTLEPELREEALAASESRRELAAEAETLSSAAKEVEALIDELNLRHVIGELSEAEFESRAAEAREDVNAGGLDEITAAMSEIDGMLAEVGGVQGRLAEAGRAREGMVGGESTPAAADADATPPQPVPPVQQPAEEWEVPPPAEEPPTPQQSAPEPEPAVQQAAPETPQFTPAPPEPVAKAPGGEDLMATGVITARPDIVQADAPPVQHSEVEGAPPGDGPRPLVILPDGRTQLYPFGGEVMSMGRGRNNDIQIKNDGKISRYHCRIFRRGDEFIIEDNKSSNGTLVDSKLVTRQRLDGGEKIQIGETRVEFFIS